MKGIAYTLLVAVCVASSFNGVNAATVFDDRQAFLQSTGPKLVDNYENPQYQHVMSDAAMSAVTGETTYFTYGGNVTDYNNIMYGFGVNGSAAYCSLCYGSFRLTFDSTSLTTGAGVYGVGLRITQNLSTSDRPEYEKHAASVVFGDDTVVVYELPRVVVDPSEFPFWGITSDTLIRSIDFIAYSSVGPERTFFIMDNLTIAAAPVPLPAGVWLVGSAIGLLGWAKRRANP